MDMWSNAMHRLLKDLVTETTPISSEIKNTFDAGVQELQNPKEVVRSVMKTYKFKALPEQCDIPRILTENPNADFIVIQASKSFKHKTGAKKGLVEKKHADEFILFINTSVLELFSKYMKTVGKRLILDEELHRCWGYTYYAEQSFLVDDDNNDVVLNSLAEEEISSVAYGFRGATFYPHHSHDVFKTITELQVLLKQLRELESAEERNSARAPAKKLTRAEKQKQLDITVKVW